MAIVKGPLLSVGARGEFADTLTYRRSKRQNVAQKYSEPSNPQTVAQTTHRALYTSATAAARVILAGAGMQDAWRTRATHTRAHQTAHSSLVKALIAAGVGVANPYFVSAVNGTGSGQLYLSWIDATTLSAAGSGGPYDVYAGNSPDSMALVEQAFIVDGEMLCSSIPVTGSSVFVEIRGSSLIRSGVMRVPGTATLITPGDIPSVVTWFHAHTDWLNLDGSNVHGWYDTGDAVPHFTQSASGNRPEFVEDGSGGTGEIRFTSTEWMYGDSTFGEQIQAFSGCYRFGSLSYTKCPFWFGTDPGRRYLHLPNGDTIYDDSDGQALFPSGSETTYVDLAPSYNFANAISLHGVVRNRDSATTPPGIAWLNGSYSGGWREDLRIRDYAWFSAELTSVQRSILQAYYTGLYSF